VALSEFDDPNIDKDEAIAGVLGENSVVLSSTSADCLFSRGRLPLSRGPVRRRQHR
jgi:hypothetical protein